MSISRVPGVPVAALAAAIAQCISPVAVAQPNQCQHLGQAVICPLNILAGSSSINFTATGIFWSDGNTSIGFSVPLFPTSSPGAQSPSQSSNPSEFASAFEQLSLTGPSNPAIEYGSELGGPIVKDKLWFFASFRLRDDNQTQSTRQANFAASLGGQTGSLNEARYFFRDQTLRSLSPLSEDGQVDVRVELGSGTSGTSTEQPVFPDLLPTIVFDSGEAQFSWTNISPRLGLTYSLGEQALLNSAYAMYADNLSSTTTGSPHSAYRYSSFYSMLDDDLNGDGRVSTEELLSGLYGPLSAEPSDLTKSFVDEELSSPLLNEIILGSSHTLTRDLSENSNFTYRRRQNTVWDVPALSDESPVRAIDLSEFDPPDAGVFEALGNDTEAALMRYVHAATLNNEPFHSVLDELQPMSLFPGHPTRVMSSPATIAAAETTDRYRSGKQFEFDQADADEDDARGHREFAEDIDDVAKRWRELAEQARKYGEETSDEKSKEGWEEKAERYEKNAEERERAADKERERAEQYDENAEARREAIKAAEARQVELEAQRKAKAKERARQQAERLRQAREAARQRVLKEAQRAEQARRQAQLQQAAQQTEPVVDTNTSSDGNDTDDAAGAEAAVTYGAGMSLRLAGEAMSMGDSVLGKVFGPILAGAGDLFTVFTFGEAANEVVDAAPEEIKQEIDEVDRLSDPKSKPTRGVDSGGLRWKHTRNRFKKLSGYGS